MVTIKTSITSFIYFTPFSNVSMVYFEQVNVNWEVYFKKRPRKPEKCS